MPYIKIASADLTNLLLIEQLLELEKDIILSTGASTEEEIIEAVNYIKQNKKKHTNLYLLHCVLNYPTEYHNADLSKIKRLQELFPDIEIGYSDHVPPDDMNLCLITAYLLGARIIEKHFTYDKALIGNDHYHAFDVNDAKHFVYQLQVLETLIGSSKKDVTQNQDMARKHARRALVAKDDILKGETFSNQNITALRPCNGISPFKWFDIKGKIAQNNIQKGTVIQIQDYE